MRTSEYRDYPLAYVSTRTSQAELKGTRPVLAQEFVASHKRRRMTDAIAELSAERGYGDAKIEYIVRRAGVARKTLYENFEGKEDLLLAALDVSIAEASLAIEEACEDAGEGWEDRIEAGLEALLGYIAEHPAQARMCMVEALSASPAATARYEAAMQSLIDLLKRSAPSRGPLPETLEETLVGGAAWIIQQQIRSGEGERAMDLHAELAHFVLSPYRGVTHPAL